MECFILVVLRGLGMRLKHVLRFFLQRLERGLHVDPHQAAWFVVVSHCMLDRATVADVVAGRASVVAKAPSRPMRALSVSATVLPSCVLQVSLIETKSLCPSLSSLSSWMSSWILVPLVSKCVFSGP